MDSKDRTLFRLWIDALTPKQALFAKALVDGAPSKVKCIVTTRDYSELNRFISRLGVKHTRVGRHGGGDLLQKLRASAERENKLISFVSKNSFDCAISFLSPEAARVSFGLGLTHHVCSDSPHANAPCRLVVPLISSVFSPFPIEVDRWTGYGIRPNRVRRYHALDPWAWLSRSGIRASRKVRGRVLIRLEEWFASYFRKGLGVSDVLSKLIDGIARIGDYEITLVPRYDDQREWTIRNFGAKCIVPKTTINGAREIAKTDLLIGGGATMTQEAALLGVPNISYFPSARLDVFTNYYFPKRLSIKASNPTQLLRTTFKMLKDVDREKGLFIERATSETRNFEDPVKFVFERILDRS